MEGWQEFCASLRALDLLPLVCAVVLGAAVGLEREWHGRPAGLRTHILVCLCSTMLIQASRLVAVEHLDLGDTGRLVFDPNRMGAGIVTGVGFLGAATVVRSGDFLRGLTTAACIWYVAGLGIVLGTGHYALAFAGTVVVMLVLTLFNRWASVIKPTIYRRLIVIASVPKVEPLVAQIGAEIKSGGMRVLDVAAGHDNGTGQSELVFTLMLKNEFQAPSLVWRVAAVEGVLNARWKSLN